MISVSFFVLSFLCAQFLDAAESSSSSQQCWEQPALGSQEEAEIIKKASRINYTLHDGNTYHTVNLFLITHFEQIQREIKEEVEERADFLKNTKYASCIPELPSFKGQSFLQQIINLLINLVSWKPDHSKVQLYEYKNCNTAIQITATAANNIDVNVGVAQRMQLYENLYNALSKRAGNECRCESHDVYDLCYLPALQAELLVNICEQLAVALSEEENKEKANAQDKIDIKNIVACKKFLAQYTQEELQNKKHWEYQPIANNIAVNTAVYNRLVPLNDASTVTVYDEPIPLSDDFATKNVQGPFVSHHHAWFSKYLPRNMTSTVERMSACHKKSALPSRQLLTSRDQTRKKKPDKNCSNERICFSDDDWGYNFFLEFPQIPSGCTFKITAHNWISNKETNKCVFAYAHEYERIPDNAQQSGTRTKQCVKHGIGCVNLPSWDMREYGIELWKVYEDRKVEMVKGIYQKRYEAQQDSRDLIEVDNEVTAVAYDPGLGHMLFSTGHLLKLGYIDSTVGAMTLDLCYLQKSIKKIFVVDDQMYLIYTQDGSIYHYFDKDKDPVELKLGLKQPIIDVAYDATRRELAFLTCDGVYTCACYASTGLTEKNSEKNKKTSNATSSFLNKPPRKVGNHAIMPTIYDTSQWSLSLADTCTPVFNSAFKYQECAYNAIDFQNGQIYAMCKDLANQKQSCVLIYPPLNPVEASEKVNIATPNASASESSTGLQGQQQPQPQSQQIVQRNLDLVNFFSKLQRLTPGAAVTG